jgi:acetyl-CoA carboxylase carboxyl transferase subunit beta
LPEDKSPPLVSIFRKPSFNSAKKKEMPEGLWQKCPECGEVIHNLELEKNQRVCPKCDWHMTERAHDRILHLVDPGSFQEMDADMVSVDTLKFKGMASYTERLRTYQERTGLKDSVISGTALLSGRRIALAVMDFHFLAATMGSVAGEKITRIIELGTRERLPVIVISASGGARMYEGMLSLMQMAKTSGALALHAKARLPYISVLTNPTTAGVMASFASLGDLILAEPKCMIGFAGPRVIKETTHQDLPPGFQTAEFLQEHGLLDMIVHRKRMRAVLSELLDYLAPS